MKPIWKNIDGKKYCKSCSQKTYKPLNKKSEKRMTEDVEYFIERAKFLKANKECCANLEGCSKRSTDVHHKSGRIGKNYLDQSTWIAVCRNCHSRIENEPLLAKSFNFSNNKIL